MNRNALKRICDTDTKYITPNFHAIEDPCCDEEHLQSRECKDDVAVMLSIIKDHFDGIITDDDVMWCQHAKHIEAAVKAFNRFDEPEGCEIYQAAAFLVVVPEFTSQRGSV